MTKHKEPSDAAVLAARIMSAARFHERATASTRNVGYGIPPFVPLSPYTAASLAERLCAIERAQEKHVLKGVNGEYSAEVLPDTGTTHEEWEEKGILRLVKKWKRDLGMPCEIVLGYEPGGPMISLKLPGEAEAVTV